MEEQQERKKPHGTPRVQEPAGTPAIMQPTWQGPVLALEQLRASFDQIRGALQPPRPDIIDRAAQQGLFVTALLEQFWAAQPPGAIAPNVPIGKSDKP